MTDEEMSIKEKQKELQAKKTELVEIEKRLNELRKNELVQEYIGLNQLIEYNLSNDDNLIRTAFSNNTSVYVYIGAYSDSKLFRNNFFPEDYKSLLLYQNLETKELVEIRAINQADFESQCKIIYLKPKSQKEYNKSFYRVRNEFLNELVRTSPEKIAKKFVMKYGSWK